MSIHNFRSRVHVTQWQRIPRLLALNAGVGAHGARHPAGAAVKKLPFLWGSVSIKNILDRWRSCKRAQFFVSIQWSRSCAVSSVRRYYTAKTCSVYSRLESHGLSHSEWTKISKFLSLNERDLRLLPVTILRAQDCSHPSE